jgi:hypothetical protein
MINCDVWRAITVLSVPVALWLDALTIWQIYLVAFVEGSLFVFFNIAEERLFDFLCAHAIEIN